tara:strand:+ start:914 stop:1300 length:387 start_codon:yes stop_codon:yes gene_type:complete
MKHNKYFSIRGSSTSATTSSEFQLDFPKFTGSSGRIYILRRFHISKTSGDATTWTPRMGHEASFTNDSIDEDVKYQTIDCSSKINDVFDAPIPIKTDGSNALYFRPGFNSGTNNAISWDFYFETVLGG